MNRFGVSAQDWQALEDEVLALFTAILRVDTTNPPGNETACAVPAAVLAPVCAGSFTDSRWVRGAFPACVAYGFAPFLREDLRAMEGGRDHMPDERVLVDDVTYQALFFERVARDLLA